MTQQILSESHNQCACPGLVRSARLSSQVFFHPWNPKRVLRSKIEVVRRQEDLPRRNAHSGSSQIDQPSPIHRRKDRRKNQHMCVTSSLRLRLQTVSFNSSFFILVNKAKKVLIKMLQDKKFDSDPVKAWKAKLREVSNLCVVSRKFADTFCNLSRNLKRNPRMKTRKGRATPPKVRISITSWTCRFGVCQRRERKIFSNRNKQSSRSWMISKRRLPLIYGEKIWTSLSPNWT